MLTMTGDEHSSIQTRPSLLHRLKDGDDVQAWQEFCLTYGKLVRDFAIQAGLTDTEADDVVQDTAIGIARNLPDFRYDPKVCRFKSWLLNQTSWRIKDQFRKRARPGGSATPGDSREPRLDSDRTATVERVIDPNTADLDGLFEKEWRRNLLALALERVKAHFTLKQIQIFDLLVNQDWAGAEVARALGVSLANVYVTKHRVTAALQCEVQQLERRMEKQR